MLCPKCSSPNAAGSKECNVCGVIFAHTRRDKPEPLSTLCAWTDVGLTCGHRGILSMTTNGQGQWYCREHWDRLNKREPKAQGNAVPEAPASIAVQEWKKAMSEYKARKEKQREAA